MAEFLAMQIRLGKITIDDIPEKYKAKVESLLNPNEENEADWYDALLNCCIAVDFHRDNYDFDKVVREWMLP